MDREIQLQLAKENMQRAFESRCKSQKSVSKVILNIDDLVLLRVPHLSDAAQGMIHKFFDLFEGPFKISRVCGSNAFELVTLDENARVKGVFNRYNLRKYHQPADNHP